MRIVGIETKVLAGAAPDPQRAAGSRSPQALVELTTDTGLTGIATASESAARAVRALARDALTGADPRSAMGLWERMGRALSAPRDLAAVHARAALDVALWDLKAKANDEPLWKTLGGARPRAVVHLAWDGPGDPVGMLEWFRQMAAATGIRSGSLPAGDDPAKDLERLAEIQRALDATVPQSALMLHFDGRGCAKDAIRHVRALERVFDLAWVRSPVRPGDFRGARQVADSVAAAVCVGRGLPGIEAYLPYLQHYAANVLELDIAVLGISGCIQMADAAFGFELPVTLSACTGHLGVRLFSALPAPMSVEIGYRACRDESCATDLTFTGGFAVAGDRPGNGLTFDRTALTTGENAAGSSP